MTGYYWIGYRRLSGSPMVSAAVYLVVGRMFVPLETIGGKKWTLDSRWMALNRVSWGDLSGIRDSCTFASPEEALAAAGEHMNRREAEAKSISKSLSVFGPHETDLAVNREDWTPGDWVELWENHYRTSVKLP